MRRSIGMVFVLIVMTRLFGGGSVSAVCPPIDGWPAFSELAGSAGRVVVGTVIETEGGLATRLRVDEILRGRSRQVLDLGRLRARLGRGADTCRFTGTVEAELDDRLAIAFSGRVEGWNRLLDTVALVDASADHPNASGLERLTVQQVRLLLGHEPDGSTVALPRRAEPPPGLLTSLLRSLPGGLFDLAVDLLGYPAGDDAAAE